MDLLYFAIGVAVFALSAVLVVGCEALRKPQ
jgi:hypothetical protein